MPGPFPPLWVDHVSIAVPEIAPALASLRRWLPIQMNVETRPGYDGQFLWTDFFVGDWKFELIESARPGSFVERFLARRGAGFHHLSIDVPGGTLDPYTALLERQGLRLVDRGDYGDGNVTTFISPRTSPGILVQFWQIPEFRGGRPPGVPTEPVAECCGVRFRVDHVAVAVRSIERATEWFRRAFPVATPHPVRRGWDGTHDLLTFWLGDFKMELVAPIATGGPIARFVERRGEGFHHIAIDVDRLEPFVARLEADGVRVVGKAEPKAGHRTAFIHPADTFGILLQFWEEPNFGGARRR
jgi:methylmalonyl-CoA/ethylmalonyl-CoA epimerase